MDAASSHAYRLGPRIVEVLAWVGIVWFVLALLASVAWSSDGVVTVRTPEGPLVGPFRWRPAPDPTVV